MVNKITDFGYNFQIKTIVCLMRDVKFIEQIHDILDEVAIKFKDYNF